MKNNHTQPIKRAINNTVYLPFYELNCTCKLGVSWLAKASAPLHKETCPHTP